MWIFILSLLGIIALGLISILAYAWVQSTIRVGEQQDAFLRTMNAKFAKSEAQTQTRRARAADVLARVGEWRERVEIENLIGLYGKKKELDLYRAASNAIGASPETADDWAVSTCERVRQEMTRLAQVAQPFAETGVSSTATVH